MLRWKYSRPLLGLLLAFVAIGPLLSFGILREPGIQQTLAVAFLYGALALTYDLLFGFTGLLSFGHAIFFASGAYLTAIFINTNHWSLFVAAPAAVFLTGVLATLIGSASLRTKGITFAMVTLAFGEAGHVIISRNFGNLTNGENGLPINAERIPGIFIGVINTKYLFWLALAVLITVYAIIWWITESSAGRVFAALRENEVRTSVLGLNPNIYKLLAFVISAVLASGIGAAMLLVSGNAAPRYASAETTIALLLMVILGGPRTRWGAVIGGIIYSVASTRLQDLNHGDALESLPKFISGPLSEPAFILGMIFIFIVMFAPGGISGAYYRARIKYLQRKSE
ncbi:MAG: branched-chain amino acid ABC transporter permease [Actinobacteria bacterium]|nr:branched-chain amino acid ABC transporter permease [Actinomycetota bacterium]